VAPGIILWVAAEGGFVAKVQTYIRLKKALKNDTKWTLQLHTKYGIMRFVDKCDILPHSTAMKSAKALSRVLGDLEIREDAW
jgi:hypothetical protein